MGTIACSCSALGALGKLITEETGSNPRTFNQNSLRHEFIYENVGSERKLEYTGAITGSLSRFKTGVREKSYLVQGTIAVQPSPTQLDIWLPRVFGAAPTGTADARIIKLDDSPPTWDMLVYRENGIFAYRDCMVAQCIIRGKTSNGGDSTEFMEMLINIVAEEEDINGTPWPVTEPTLGNTVDYLPYTFWETTLTLDTQDIEYEQFTLMIDNNLDIRFYNSQTPQCIRSTGRDITMEVQAPFTCNNLTKSTLLNTADKVGIFKMESGLMSTTFNFPALRNTFTTPTTPGKQTIPLKFGLEAFATDENDEVDVINDSDPAI